MSARRQSGRAGSVPAEAGYGPAALATLVTILAVYLPKLPFTTPYTPRFAGVLLAAAAWTWAFAGARHAFRFDRRVVGAVLGVGVVTLASAVQSPDPGAALTWGAEGNLMSAPTWLALLTVFAFASGAVLGPRVRTAASWGFLWAGAAALTVLIDVARGSWVSSGFGNSNFVSAALIPFLPLACYLSRESAVPRLRRAWFALGLLCAAGVAVAGSLAGVAGLAVALGALFIVAPLAVGPASWRRRLRVAGVSVLVVLALALAVVGVSVSTDALPQVRAALGITAETRVEMWKVALGIAKDHPLLGVGADGVPLASQSHLTEQLLRLEAGGYTDYRVLMRDPHSLPALAAASLGIIGLCALAWLAVVWYKTLRMRLAEPGPGAGWRLALVAGLTGHLFALLMMPWSVVFGGLAPLFAGLAIAPGPRSAQDGDSATTRPRAVGRVAVVAALVATGLALYLSAAAMMGDASIMRAVSTQNADTAAAAYSRASSIQPTRSYPAYEALYARGFRDAAQDPDGYRAAVDDAPKGVRLSAGYMASLVEPLLDASWPPDGRDLSWETDVLSRAAEVAPRHPNVVLEQAHLALARGDFEAARERLDHAKRIGAGTQARFALYDFLATQPRIGNEEDEVRAEELRRDRPGLAPLVTLLPR